MWGEAGSISQIVPAKNLALGLEVIDDFRLIRLLLRAMIGAKLRNKRYRFC